MKILIAFYPIDDMGGIINHTEELTVGLRTLGHEVTARLLVWRDSAPRSVAGGTATTSVLGMKFDQRRGYTWTKDKIIPYKGRENIAKWLEFSSQFDLIIWQIPVPTKRKENRGNMDWLELYNAAPRQMAVIHDGNFLDSYPWLYFVRNRINGLICVHDCAFNSARNISVPSSLIYNPFGISYPDLSREKWETRAKGFLSVQTWKAWKRVPELLSSIPYMRKETRKIVAGKGIDYYYLTSEEKCKYPGVWGDAIVNGMHYIDVISNTTRNKYLSWLTCQVDASWSKKYAAIGAHFNRVTVEAIIEGCLPIVRDVGVRGSVLEDCPQIPMKCSMVELGQAIDHYCHLSYEEYLGYMDKLVPTLNSFNRYDIAERIVQPDSREWFTGEDSPSVKLAAATAIREFFNDN